MRLPIATTAHTVLAPLPAYVVLLGMMMSLSIILRAVHSATTAHVRRLTAHRKHADCDFCCRNTFWLVGSFFSVSCVIAAFRSIALSSICKRLKGSRLAVPRCSSPCVEKFRDGSSFLRNLNFYLYLLMAVPCVSARTSKLQTSFSAAPSSSHMSRRLQRWLLTVLAPQPET